LESLNTYIESLSWLGEIDCLANLAFIMEIRNADSDPSHGAVGGTLRASDVRVL
jgi:hypothetical protein